MGRCAASHLALAVVLGGWAVAHATLWAREGAARPPEPPLRPLVPDVNRSPARHLLLLPRIGPARARAIVADRRRAGPFGRLEDLQRIRGIGPATVRDVAPFATAGGP